MSQALVAASALQGRQTPRVLATAPCVMRLPRVLQAISDDNYLFKGCVCIWSSTALHALRTLPFDVPKYG